MTRPEPQPPRERVLSSGTLHTNTTRKLPAILLPLVFLAGACGVNTSVVMLDPAGPRYSPLPADSVWVFASPECILIDYQPIASIRAGSNTTGGMAPEADDVITALRETAGGLGAHAIVLDEVMGQRMAPVGAETLPARGEATAIRLGDGVEGGAELMSAARRLEGIRRVALAPIPEIEGFGMPDSIRVGFEEEIEYRLGTAGYEVVPGEAYDSIWMEYAREAGGVYDPFSGRRRGDLLSRVEQRTRQRLIDEHRVDGFVIPEIWSVLATYSGLAARWHGTEQSIFEPGAPIPAVDKVAGFLLNAFLCDEEDEPCEVEDRRGVVAAASLMVRLENSIGAALYTGVAGIDLMELVDQDSWETYPRLEAPPFSSADRNREAVLKALEGLIGRR